MRFVIYYWSFYLLIALFFVNCLDISLLIVYYNSIIEGGGVELARKRTLDEKHYLSKGHYFALRLLSLIERKGCMQQDFAEAIEVTSGYISKLISSGDIPSIEVLKKMRKYFNVSIDYILGLDIEDANELSTMLTSKICKNIKELRIKRGLSQKDFASLNDISLNELISIEDGKTPSGDILVKIAAFSGISLDELAGDKKQIIEESETEKIIKFAANTDNREYIKLIMEVKEKGIPVNEILVARKF